MSAKGSFLILRRFRAGEEDLILKAYGTCGLAKVLVPGGLKTERGLLGYIEPFNFISVYYKQSGNIIILQDLLEVEFLSYLCMEDYERYIWMSSVALFAERWFLHYDPELLSTLIFYMSINPRNQGVFLLRFKLEFLRRLGLYKEEVFEERLRNLVRRLADEGSLERLEGLRVSRELLTRLDQAISVHLSSSL